MTAIPWAKARGLPAITLAAEWPAVGVGVSLPRPTSATGIVIVVQNLVSSLVNSRLFDFSRGWLHVGVAGGMAIRWRDSVPAMHPAARP